MTAIHHNTVKRAAKFGIRFEELEGAISAYNGTDVLLGQGKTAKEALEQALLAVAPAKAPKAPKASKPKKSAKRKARKQADDEDGDEDDEPVEKSVVKRKYKKAYRPFKMTCGDTLAQQISAHVCEIDDEIGEKRINAKKLRDFATANGVWVSTYAHLNPGMRRMNIANRLRAKVRKGHKVIWA